IFIEGSGDIDHARTMAFMTIFFYSMFNVFNARSEERSAFAGLFSNALLWGAIALSVALQAAVLHVPFLQAAFSTTPLDAGDWLLCAATGSTVLWLGELGKLGVRLVAPAPGGPPPPTAPPQ